MSRTEYEEDLQAELGYRTAGRREIAQREWFSLRGEAGEIAPNPKAFKKLVNVIRATNWIKNNRARFNARCAKRMREQPPEVKAVRMAAQTKARHDAYKANPPVFTCVGCGSVFCRVPWAQSRGIPPRFCSTLCKGRSRATYLQGWRRSKKAAQRTKVAA